MLGNNYRSLDTFFACLLHYLASVGHLMTGLVVFGTLGSRSVVLVFTCQSPLMLLMVGLLLVYYLVIIEQTFGS